MIVKLKSAPEAAPDSRRKPETFDVIMDNNQSPHGEVRTTMIYANYVPKRIVKEANGQLDFLCFGCCSAIIIHHPVLWLSMP